MRIRIGTRASNLSLLQTKLVIERIEQVLVDAEVEIVKITTKADKLQNSNLQEIGGKGLFVAELEEELLKSNIDLAVHSLKDVPGIIDKKLPIAAVLPRQDARDALITHQKYIDSIEDLSKMSVIGTSSPRRKIFIEKLRPDIKVVPLRGNIETRIKALNEKKIDAIILSKAALIRANLDKSIPCYTINPDKMLPAACQGTIAIQTNIENREMYNLCKMLNDLSSWYITRTERSFIEYLKVDCHIPVGAFAKFLNSKIVGRFMVVDKNNELQFFTSYGTIFEADQIGIEAAMKLKKFLQ